MHGRVKGKVKFFNVQRGYGFVECENFDVFVHIRALSEAEQMAGGLEQGQRVECDVVETPKGKAAACVVVLS